MRAFYAQLCTKTSVKHRMFFFIARKCTNYVDNSNLFYREIKAGQGIIFRRGLTLLIHDFARPSPDAAKLASIPFCGHRLCFLDARSDVRPLK